jgi:hypothetical protein
LAWHPQTVASDAEDQASFAHIALLKPNPAHLILQRIPQEEISRSADRRFFAVWRGSSITSKWDKKSGEGPEAVEAGMKNSKLGVIHNTDSEILNNVSCLFNRLP